jgi:hypothetical protein
MFEHDSKQNGRSSEVTTGVSSSDVDVDVAVYGAPRYTIAGIRTTGNRVGRQGGMR